MSPSLLLPGPTEMRVFCHLFPFPLLFHYSLFVFGHNLSASSHLHLSSNLHFLFLFYLFFLCRPPFSFFLVSCVFSFYSSFHSLFLSLSHFLLLLLLIFFSSSTSFACFWVSSFPYSFLPLPSFTFCISFIRSPSPSSPSFPFAALITSYIFFP